MTVLTQTCVGVDPHRDAGQMLGSQQPAVAIDLLLVLCNCSLNHPDYFIHSHSQSLTDKRSQSLDFRHFRSDS